MNLERSDYSVKHRINDLGEHIKRAERGEKLIMSTSLDLSQEDAKAEDVPPDGGYGWVCVACVFLMQAHTWGLNSVREGIS